MTTMAYQITSLTVVYSTVCSDADQRKHQSSASLVFVWGIHRDRWIPRTKGQLSGKCFHLMTSSCPCLQKLLPHEDVMTWTLFPHHWPWMESGGFLSKGPVIRTFMFYSNCCTNFRTSSRIIWLRSETPSLSGDVTVTIFEKIRCDTRIPRYTIHILSWAYEAAFVHPHVTVYTGIRSVLFLTSIACFDHLVFLRGRWVYISPPDKHCKM